MSVVISPGGLSGLVMKISDELLNGKSLDEILSKYPISKTALPYLLTLHEEHSVLLLDFIKDEYSPLEKENERLKREIESLKAQIKPSEMKKDSSDTQTIIELRNALKRLENEKNELENELSSLERQLQLYESFFESNSLCSMFYRNYLKKVSK